MKLLNIDANPKTVKGFKLGYQTAVLYMAPGLLSGVEMCKHRSRQCFKDCLFFAGRGQMKMVQNSRINKARFLHTDKKKFLAQLHKEIDSHIKSANKRYLKPVIRLNGTTDWPWEMELHQGLTLFEHFPKENFYDYCKSYDRMVAYLKGEMPPNYHLTFSLHEDNAHFATEILKNGGNVAVVFRDSNFPATYLKHKVIDGDEHDLRFTDPSPVIVGLTAKGKAKRTTTVNAFVKETA